MLWNKSFYHWDDEYVDGVDDDKDNDVIPTGNSYHGRWDNMILIILFLIKLCLLKLMCFVLFLNHMIIRIKLSC